MATGTTPSAEVVGNAFVEQYYHILHQNPELMFRFYQDSSALSRPEPDGEMKSVTTLEGIKDYMLSIDFKEYKAEIKTAEAQKSFQEGVVVLVTGCLTDKNNLKRKFVQSFFLAPQDHGYFVLNDVFRYVDEEAMLKNAPAKEGDDAATISKNSEPEPAHVPDPPAAEPVIGHHESGENIIKKAHDASAHERQLVNEEPKDIETPSHSYENDVQLEVESASTMAPDDAPKKSYASIVKVAKGSPGVTKVYVPTNTVKVAPKKTESQSHGSAVPAPVPEVLVPSSTSTPESSNNSDAVEGHSIYIRNLPFSVTADQLEAEFKKFGTIVPGGVQVRNNRQQGYCFGFVEFESVGSMDSAIQASPIYIGGRQATVEIKRTTTRVGSNGRGGGRIPSGRGGFRSESFRGRGGYGGVGGRSFGRNEANRAEFSGRGRGSAGRGDGYQQARGRTVHPSGPRQDAAVST